MFYAQLILAKRGTLGKVWLAAHWHTKLTKAQVLATDIADSVQQIIEPDVPMALRMSGHLLLGVARIYAKQVDYLLTECNDVLIKIRMTLKPGETQIDLRPETTVAAHSAITLRLDLPENVGDLELTMPELPEAALPEVDENQLLNLKRATKRDITLDLMGVDDPTELTQQTNLMRLLDDWGTDPIAPDVEEPPQEVFRDERDVATPIRAPEFETADYEFVSPGIGLEPAAPEFGISPATPGVPGIVTPGTPGIQLPPTPGTPGTPGFTITIPKQSKKGVLVDAVSTIDSKTIKRQLEDTSSIVRELKSAPPTKKAMKRREREITGAESLLAMPMAIEGLSPQLASLFTRNLNMKFPYLQRAEQVEEISQIPEESPIKSMEAEYEPAAYEAEPYSPERPSQREEDISTPADLHVPTASQEQAQQEEEEEEARREGPEYSDRTRKMHNFLQKNFGDKVNSLSYLNMVQGKKRHVVVGTFFELLVLKSTNVIKVKQDKPYGDITIEKGAHFNQEVIVAS